MIFADTSFWFAAGHPRDSHSAAARRIAAEHPSEQIVTTNHVLGETWTLFNTRASRWAALDFLDRLQSSPRIDVLHVEPAVEAEAWTWLRRDDERRYSFVDATSFAVMRRHGITRAFAFDDDFAAAGFEVLTSARS